MLQIIYNYTDDCIYDIRLIVYIHSLNIFNKLFFEQEMFVVSISIIIFAWVTNLHSITTCLWTEFG